MSDETFEITAPVWAYDEIWASLSRYSATQPGGKQAYKFRQTDRKSSSPDYGFFIYGFEFGPKDSSPVFGLIIRHEEDYGQEVDEMIKSEMEEFFDAGVQVVWDVDVLRDKVIRVYRATNPENPTVYRKGEIAEAEPAVPGWQMPVSDRLFYSKK